MSRPGLVRILLYCLALSPAPLNGLVFRGTVIDARTRQPVPYAEVHAFELDARTLTDSAGSFELLLEPAGGRVALEVSRVGYRTRVWHLLAASHPLLLLLPETVELEGVTVTAFRSPVSAANSGPVTVLDEKDLAPRGRTSLAEAFARTPSATVQDYGNLTTLSLRGATAEQTLFMLDGVRLNSAQDNLVDLTTMPLSLGRRVEVARGGNSALYGANSVGGAVNIITPEPGRLGARVTGGLGSFGKKYLDVLHTNRHRSLGYVVGVDLSRIDNRFAWRDSNDSVRYRDNADISGTDILAKGVLQEGRHHASLLGDYHRGSRGIPGAVTYPLDSARLSDSRAIAQCSYDYQLTESTLLEAALFHHRLWRSYHDPNPYFPQSDTHYTTATGAALKGSRAFGSTDVLVLGVESDEQNLSSTSVGDPARLTAAAWSEVRIGVFGVVLAPAVRCDYLRDTRTMPDSSQFLGRNRVLSPRFVVSYSLPRLLNLYVAGSRSFRTPTFNELYWPGDQFTRGNPQLKPERATSLEVGANGSALRFLTYSVAGYLTDLVDLIQWQPDSAGVFRPVNVDTASITGVEMGLGFHSSHLAVDGSASYLVARSHERDLAYRPRLGFAVNHRLTWRSLGLDWQVRYTAKRYTTPDNDDSLPSYLLLDAGLSFAPRLGRTATALRAGIRNLLDREYEAVKDYPVPGRNWYAEMELGI